MPDLIAPDVYRYCETVIARLVDAGVELDPLERALPAFIPVSALIVLAVERGLDLGLLFARNV